MTSNRIGDMHALVVRRPAYRNFSFRDGARRLTNRVSVSATICLLLASRIAAADRDVHVEVDASVPFAAAELADAIRMRVRDAGPPIELHVIAADGGVEVSSDRGSRVVALDGHSGADAARVVALAAVDLALDDLAVAPTPLVVRTAPAPAPTPPMEKPITIAVLATAAAWSNALAGAALDVAIPRGRWLVAFDVGAGELLDDSLDLVGAVVRFGGGIRIGVFDVRAGATLVPIKVSTGAGDETVLVGGGASVRVRVPIAASARFVLAGGADAFATRTEYRTGDVMTATPWVTPWLGAGIEMTP